MWKNEKKAASERVQVELIVNFFLSKQSRPRLGFSALNSNFILWRLREEISSRSIRQVEFLTKFPLALPLRFL